MSLSVPVSILFIFPVFVREIIKESLIDALSQFSAKVNFVNENYPKDNKVLSL